MKVYNVTIPPSAIDAVVERMREYGVIDIPSAARCLEDNGVSSNGYYGASVSLKAAQRIIQQQRKAGNIAYRNGVWMWIGG